MSNEFIKIIKSHIGKNELSIAIDKIKHLLAHSPMLNEALLHSAKLHDLNQNIRRGTVSKENAEVTKNQISWSLLSLLDAINQQKNSSGLEEVVSEMSVLHQQQPLQEEYQKAWVQLKGKNMVVDSSLSAAGDIRIGDETSIHGNRNIIIQGITDSTISIKVDGEVQEINRKLDALQQLLFATKSKQFQTGEKLYDIDTLSNSNFDFIVAQSAYEQMLPDRLVQDIIPNDSIWVQSLRRDLLQQGVAVGKQAASIFQHYGWLIEEFLRKMETPPGRGKTLRRLSFMVEAFQSSLRYLSFIQLAQLFKLKRPIHHPLIARFFKMSHEEEIRFDYLSLLLATTQELKQEESLVPQIGALVEEIQDIHSDIYRVIIFLDHKRTLLIEQKIQADKGLSILLDEYLTALVFWLRKIAFIAKFRLISIKDISLHYRLGTPRNFIHLYGELHGVYNQAFADEADYNEVAIEGLYTFNQSVLLLDSPNTETGLEKIHDENTYISLSPLIIDLSVFSEKPTQTPEIFYFMGYQDRTYFFARYKKELQLESNPRSRTQDLLQVKAQNNRQPKLDDLFDQLKNVFSFFVNSPA